MHRYVLIQVAFIGESNKVLLAEFIQSACFMEKAGVSLSNTLTIAAYISVPQ